MLQAWFLLIPITTAQVPCLVEKGFSCIPFSSGPLSSDGWLATIHQNDLKVFDPFARRVTGPFEEKIKPFFLLEGLRSVRQIEGKPEILGIPFCTFIFGNNHRTLYIGDSNGKINKWNPLASKEPVLLISYKGKRVGKLWISPSEEILVIDLNDGGFHFWNFPAQREVHWVGKSTSALAFSPDGKMVAFETSEKLVVLNIASFKELWGKQRPQTGFSIANIDFSPDGRLLIVCQNGWHKGIIHFFNSFNGRPVHDPIILKSGRPSEPFRTEVIPSNFPSAKISPNGLFLACSYNSREIQLWEMATMRKAYSFAGNWGEVNGILFTHSKRLITTSQHPDVCLWDLSRHELWRGFEWDGLMSWDPMAGVAATEYYYANPKEFLKILGDKPLVPAIPQPKRIAELMQNLKKPVGNIREDAKKMLIGYGEHVETALRLALAKEKDLDGQILIQDILAKVKKVDGLGPHDHRLLRVVFILEKIGTPECLPFLKRIEKESSHPAVKTRACQVASRLKNLWEKPENGCRFLGRRVPCT